MYTIEFTLFDSDEVIKVSESSSLDEAERIVEKLNSPTRSYAMGLFRVAT